MRIGKESGRGLGAIIPQNYCRGTEKRRMLVTPSFSLPTIPQIEADIMAAAHRIP
jgi:hypothetical protein